jgi:DNA polymerase III psi subunit
METGSVAKNDHVKTTIASSAAPAPSSLGENRKGVIIGVDYADAATIRENELTFLLNILNACKLGLRDVVILNLHGLPASSKQQICKMYQASVFLMFGLSAADLSLPVRFPDYQRQTFDGIQYLSAPPLSALEHDPLAKKQLWASLKAMFLNG